MVCALLVGCSPTSTTDEPLTAPTATEPAQSGSDEPPEGWVSAFDLKMQSLLQQENIPGMAVALIKGSETVLAKGYGLRDVENQLTVDENTLFPIASSHKAINATLIAVLVDNGVVDWDEPVVNYYSQFELSSAQSTEQVTLTHLLSMTSGIAGDAEDRLKENDTIADLFKLVSQEPLLGAPGEVFSYSNISASLAGYIGTIASIGIDSGLIKNYGILLRERVLLPIGMTRSTTLHSEAELDGNLAKAYSVGSDGSWVFEPSVDTDDDILAPSGSLKSSAWEMAMFIATQLNNGVAPNHNTIVSEQNLQKTHETVLDGYALGWENLTYKQTDILAHTGSYDGFVSAIALLPEYNIGLVLLVNSEDAGETLTEQVHKILIDILAQ